MYIFRKVQVTGFGAKYKAVIFFCVYKNRVLVMYYSFIPFLVIFFSINESLSILFRFSSFFKITLIIHLYSPTTLFKFFFLYLLK